MKFSEVIGLLAQGKKMRSLEWVDYAYIRLLDGEIIDENENSYNFIEDDVIDEWEEYIEPETKKIEKLDYRIEEIVTHSEMEFILIDSIKANKHKINEIVERMNELCGEK